MKRKIKKSVIEKINNSTDCDPLIKDVAMFFIDNGSVSVTKAQRKFNISYPRAARIVDRLDELGAISPPEVVLPKNFNCQRKQRMKTINDPDPLLNDVIDFLFEKQNYALSSIEKEFNIDTFRAAKIKKQLEEANIINSLSIKHSEPSLSSYLSKQTRKIII